MSRSSNRSRERARRQAASRRSARTEEPKNVEIGIGGFIGSFLAVLVLGAAALGGWWFLAGPGAQQAGAPNSAATGTQPGSVSGRVSAEIGASFTAIGEPVLGSGQAPVTIVDYSDFQCPNCRQFALEVVPWLKESWMQRGLVRVVYRDFTIRGEDSYRAAMAAQCAADQGRFWSYHDALYESFEREGATAYAMESLVATAAATGIDAERLAACLADERHRATVEASTRGAHDQGFEGTPTYLINGRQVAGAIEIADWEALFQAYAQEFSAVETSP